MENLRKVTPQEYWRIDDLKALIENADDTFGKVLSRYKSGTNYYDVQIRSFAYAIIVMREIVCLLENGFPDGALSRSRRIYEQMIILCFLNSRQNDSDFDKLIERYCASHNLTAYKNILKMYEFWENSEKIKETIAIINEIKNKHKETFLLLKNPNDYWWTGDPKYNTFSKIQDEYNDPFSKIMYKSACVATHAGALGDYALLGRHNPNGERIFTGSTSRGFSVPLILSVFSFYNLIDMVFKNLSIESDSLKSLALNLIESYKTTLIVKDVPLE